MIQPDTLQSLLERLDHFGLDKTDFKDIQIKSAELIKQLFPLDSATTVYEINSIQNFDNDRYGSIKELKSILESKLQTIIRNQNIQRQITEKAEIQRINNEQKTKQLVDNQNNLFIEDLRNTITRLSDEISSLRKENLNNIKTIKILNEKITTNNINKFIKDLSFWSVIIAVCALALYLGYYWGSNRFDSEKFSLKDQNDHYKHQNDSLRKITSSYKLPMKHP